MNNCICSSQFRTVVLEKTLERPLGSKEIKPVNPKGNQPEYSLERLMLKLKPHLLWPAETMCRVIRKDLDAGKDRR